MSSSLPTLPLDIFEHIIAQRDLDNPEDYTFLTTLSLVSSSLRELCQKRLFHTIRLCSKGARISFPNARLLQLLSIIENNPRISGYVRYIRLLDSWQSPAGETWMKEDSGTLVSLLNLLVSSPSFYLSGFSFGTLVPTGLDWAELDPELRASVLRILALGTLERFGLWRVHVPIWFLRVATPGMKMIRIIQPKFKVDRNHGDELDAELPVVDSNRGVQPRYFSLVLDRSAVSADVDIIGNNIGLDLSQVKELEIEVFAPSTLNVARFFLLSNITELTLIAGHLESQRRDGGEMELFDLSTLKSLVTLHLDCLYPVFLEERLFNWVKDVLSSLPSPNPSLRTLRLKFSIWSDQYDPDDWSHSTELLNLLTNWSRDPRGVLDSVNFILRLSWVSGLFTNEKSLEEWESVCLEKIGWQGKKEMFSFSVVHREVAR